MYFLLHVIDLYLKLTRVLHLYSFNLETQYFLRQYPTTAKMPTSFKPVDILLLVPYYR